VLLPLLERRPQEEQQHHQDRGQGNLAEQFHCSASGGRKQKTPAPGRGVYLTRKGDYSSPKIPRIWSKLMNMLNMLR
jgi:hypothetical protein